MNAALQDFAEVSKDAKKTGRRLKCIIALPTAYVTNDNSVQYRGENGNSSVYDIFKNAATKLKLDYEFRTKDKTTSLVCEYDESKTQNDGLKYAFYYKPYNNERGSRLFGVTTDIRDPEAQMGMKGNQKVDILFVDDGSIGESFTGVSRMYFTHNSARPSSFLWRTIPRPSFTSNAPHRDRRRRASMNLKDSPSITSTKRRILSMWRFAATPSDSGCSRLAFEAATPPDAAARPRTPPTLAASWLVLAEECMLLLLPPAWWQREPRVGPLFHDVTAGAVIVLASTVAVAALLTSSSRAGGAAALSAAQK